MYQSRISKIQAQLQADDVAAMALLPGPNLLYLSGMHTHMSERPIVMIVPAKGDPRIVIPLLEAPKAARAGMAESDIFAWGDGDGFTHAFAELAEVLQLKNAKIGVESLYMR
ncbi:MAG: aminopeptidase P family N-terminal domain-containing protein, partial [Chloroflexota bacterium]